MSACTYPVEDGLTVSTESARLTKLRKVLLELMLASAPVPEELISRYGADKSRFEAESTRCILCGLCVRYCAEVKKANAIGFVGSGINRRIAFSDEAASSGVCINCRECFALCPTGKLANETVGGYFEGLTVADFISEGKPI